MRFTLFRALLRVSRERMQRPQWPHTVATRHSYSNRSSRRSRERQDMQLRGSKLRLGFQSLPFPLPSLRIVSVRHLVAMDLSGECLPTRLGLRKHEAVRDAFANREDG